MSDELAIGVDLGATKIATALVTRGGKVLASLQTPTLASEGSAAVFDRIAAEIRSLLHSLPLPPGEGRGEGERRTVLGIGIGSAGLIDNDSGTVVVATNLNWENVPLAREVSRRLNNIATFVENDANANVLGEGYYGSAVGCQHYVLITLGSGLGCGIVSHGRLITGASALAGNLGHYSIDPDNGIACVCGHRGCAEMIASGPGLAALVGDGQTPDEILTAARTGDALASSAVAKMAKVVGEVATVTAAVIDPQVLIIGGGLGVAAFDLIHEGIAREMSRRLPPPQKVPPLRAAALASPAVGAATLVWERRRRD